MTLTTDKPAPLEPHKPSRNAKWITAAVLFVVLAPLAVGLILMAADGSSDGSGSENEVVGSGTVVNETRPVAGFEGVSLMSAGRILLIQGSEESLLIEADDNLMAYIKTEVRGGSLRISAEKDGEFYDLDPSRQIVFRIGVIDLTDISVLGFADIDMDSLETDRLDLDIRGAADVEIENLTADEVRVSVPGYADIRLSGTVPGQDVSWMGAGDYDGGNLRSATVEVDLLGAATLELWATESLDLSIAGAGTIEYYGNPTLTQSITGLGTVRSLGTK